jgi:hypothetical protein
MLPNVRSFGLVAALGLGLLAGPAGATFHLIQIEQAIGGVCGDTTQQAVQLRMRSAGQNQVSAKQIIAYDAAGLNPVVLVTFPSNVAVSTSGARITVATAAFAAAQGFTPDFTIASPIPASYLAAGRLTFEGPGLIVWGLAWGGAGYTGSNAGSLDNDADGNYGPPWPFALPSGTDQALRFTGAATALSTSNAADYAVTPAEATFTRNNGTSVTIADCFLFADGFESGNTSGWSTTTP